MKIAQVIASKGWGGRELVPLLLARQLSKKGHKTIVWADPDSPTGREALRMRLELRPLRFGGYINPSGIRTVLRLLRDEHPDIIHLHHSRDLAMVTPALRWAGWDGLLVLTKHVGSGVAKKDPYHRFLYSRVDLGLACATEIAENLVATCPISAGKVRVAYEPVDLERFKFKSDARRKWRKSWNAGNRFVFGMVSRLTPGKGHELLLETAARVLKKFPRAMFRVAGKASPDEQAYAQKLNQLRDSLGLKGAFEFVGHTSDVPGFLSALDTLIHGAHAEAFGMAVAEGLACGRPVLVRNGAGVSEILVQPDGRVKGGRLIDSEDPDEWAEMLLKYTRNKRLVRRLGREAKPAAARFGLATFTKQHLKWYQEFALKANRWNHKAK